MTAQGLNLGAYLRRIGHAGPCAPDLATLRALVAAQAHQLPFENLDVLCGRPIRLDPAALTRKLLEGRRGGYCFELNTLLLEALDAIGFRVTALGARVLWRRPPGELPPRTHMLVRVELPQGPYLADVGFGGGTPTVPLALVAGLEQPTPLGTFRLIPPSRLVSGGPELDLQVRHDEAWSTLYRLAPEPQLPVDRELANWFVATHPDSIFRRHLMVALPEAGARRALSDGEQVRRTPEGAITHHRRHDEVGGLLAALAADFGIEPADATERAAWAAALHGLVTAGPR
ncbi:MAG: arylamine N-acetyltransferase [Geminicoccaceae bacterium]